MPNVEGLAFGKADERPEDVVVALLQALPSGDWRQDAVVAGWGEARRCVDPVLEDLPCDAIVGDQIDEAFSRVFRVAERTGHDRLRSGVFSDLQLVIDHPDASGIHIQQVVAAAAAYQPKDADMALWEPALDIEEIAAYAFRALVRIGPARARISEFLERLASHQYNDGWDISVYFIAEYARTAFGSDEDIRAASQRIQEDHPSLWQKIKQNGPRDPCWSDSWLPMPKLEAKPSSEMRTRLPTSTANRCEQVGPALRTPLSSPPAEDMRRIFLVGDVQGVTFAFPDAFRLVLRRGTTAAGSYGKWTTRQNVESAEPLLHNMTDAAKYRLDESQMASAISTLLEFDLLSWVAKGGSKGVFTEVKKHA